MDSNLVIDDDYVKEVGNTSYVRGKKFEEILHSYVEILKEIENEAITSGDMFNALVEFRECVALLNDRITKISSNIDTLTEGFIIDVNEADDYLF